MATGAYHIRSNYNPEKDRKRLELETGQLEEDVIAETVVQRREDDPWLTEKPFGTSARVLRPPRFVPATIDYNEWGSESKSLNLIPERQEKEDESTESVSGWYRSLTSRSPGGTPRINTPAPRPRTPPLKGEKPPSSSLPKNAAKRDRNNWFISRALEASASLSASTTSSPAASSEASSPAPTPIRTPTLADILARDPPPLPTEEKYMPPVWLAIGPGNKGFDMMQKRGWEEGEALGRFSRNRGGLGYRRKGKEKAAEQGENMIHIKKEVIDITSVDHEIVDLTLSDDDEDSKDAFSHRPGSPPINVSPTAREEHEILQTDLDHSPRALITPLPTVLKSDRLGIGLKAKTMGSGIYRAPIKRITHSQAALEAHAREAEERRRLKKLVGRGRRGFERVDKREQEKRKALLAYLNT